MDRNFVHFGSAKSNTKRLIIDVTQSVQRNEEKYPLVKNALRFCSDRAIEWILVWLEIVRVDFWIVNEMIRSCKWESWKTPEIRTNVTSVPSREFKMKLENIFYQNSLKVNIILLLGLSETY